jgi:DNA-binding CsgD family transcriptional regulator
MLDTLHASDTGHPMPYCAVPKTVLPHFKPQGSLPWLTRVMDEIDYGVLIVVDLNEVVYLNHAARVEIDAGHPLQLLGRELRAQQAHDVARVHDALAGAMRGLRKLVTLGEPGARVGISVVPLGLLDDGSRATLVMLGKRQMCEPLSLQWFARSHALTPAESRVLQGLCDGLEPREVAVKAKVGLATVRTQIGNIRAKTGADSIRQLVHQVAVLPPMLSTLRMLA